MQTPLPFGHIVRDHKLFVETMTFTNIIEGGRTLFMTCDWPFLKSVICEKANFNSVI